jgi:hypothetical protein
VVVRSTPFHRTLELETKLPPFTVRVKADPPAAAEEGEMVERVGTGLFVGVPVVVSGLLVATAREALLRRIVNRRALLNKISGILLILVGVYLIYYYLDSYWI